MANDYNSTTMTVRTIESLDLNNKSWGDDETASDLLIDSASQFITTLSTTSATLVDVEWGAGALNAGEFRGADLARVRVRNESTTETARIVVMSPDASSIFTLLPGAQFEWRRPFYMIDPTAGNWWQTTAISKVDEIAASIDPGGGTDFNVSVLVTSYVPGTFPIPT